MVALYSQSIYLAARYSRRLELVRIRTYLESLGWSITGRWLDGSHQIDDKGTPIGEDGEALIEGGSTVAAAHLRARFAVEDLADVERASMLVAFTENPRVAPSRGGRHVELGYALGLDKRVIVVGHRENVFCWLRRIEFCERTADLYTLLGEAP